MTIDARGGVDRMEKNEDCVFNLNLEKRIIASNIIIGFSLAVAYSIDILRM